MIEHFRGYGVLKVTMIKIKRKAKKAAPTTEAGRTEAPKTAAPKANRVSLELIKPEAKNVFVAGSFNEWKPEKAPLVRVGDGRWAGDLAVKPGRHEYLFVVDGQWLPDPNAKESVENPFGGKNSVLVVSE
jgi:1,4-alpha-glucan branching enzyme